MLISLKNVQAPQKVDKDKPVRPTLLIGLGGSGKEVLLRLRRLIVEHYGSLKALPCISYLHLDTDQTQASREQYDLKAGDDPLYEQVRFQQSEKVELKITGGMGRYLTHIRTFPHIKRWFQTKGKIASLGDLGEGAGTVRMASRLGFFHNFSAIAAGLNRANAMLREPSVSKAVGEFGFEYNPDGMDVYIIGSLGGGTGSGTFLDSAFLIRDLFPGSERMGILFMPTLFSDYPASERIYANGYAALMELNHYSFGNKFLADWGSGSARLLTPPPFSYTYLIDSTNEAGFSIGSSGKECSLYQMVAETLFQDYWYGSYAGQKRATRINMLQFNQNVYAHDFWEISTVGGQGGDRLNISGDTYPTRFGSFGLGSITFPTDRLHNACGCRLAVRILDYWQSHIVSDPLDTLVTRFLCTEEISFMQGRYTPKDGRGAIDRKDVQNELLWFDQSASIGFPVHIEKLVQSLAREMMVLPKGRKAEALQRFRNEFNANMGTEDSEKSSDWGPYARKIRQNAEQAVIRLKRVIEDRAGKMASDPDFGITHTVVLLQELKKLLAKGEAQDIFRYRRYFEIGIPVSQSSAARCHSLLEQHYLDLQKAESMLLFSKHDCKRAIRMLQGEGSEKGSIYNYAITRIMKLVYRWGKYVVDEIDEFLGKDDPSGKGLIGKYYQLLGGLDRLKSLFHRKEAYFLRTKHYDFNADLFRQEDVDTWYQVWTNGDRENQQVEMVGNSILQDVFHVQNVSEALEYVQRTPADEIEERMLSYTKAFFVRQAQQPNALELLMDNNRMSKQQRRELINSAYNMGKVWLKQGSRGLEHVNYEGPKDYQKPMFIGVDTSNPLTLNLFREAITEIQKPGEMPPNFLSIGHKHASSIVFYSELAGVTAFSAESVVKIKGLKEAYQTHYNGMDFNNPEELHTDKDRFKFSDIVPKTDEEALRYSESLRAFVLARILGLLKVEITDTDPQNPVLNYSYEYEQDFTLHSVGLGNEAHAIDNLYRDVRDHDSQRVKLIKHAEDVIAQLRLSRHIANYLFLIEFYTKQVYPVMKHRDDQIGVQYNQYSPPAAMLDHERKRIYRDMIVDPAERERVANALIALRGKKLEQELSYEEYAERLKPFTRESGVFPVQISTTVGALKIQFQPTFVLNITALIPQAPGTQYTPPKPAGKVAAAEAEAFGHKRECPQCDKEIDARATFCRHCQKRVAEQITCPHCAETKVTDDATVCWRCGKQMPVRKPQLTCPACYSFKGTEDEFPCKVCSYALGDKGGAATSTAQQGPTASEQRMDSTSGASSGQTANPKEKETPTMGADFQADEEQDAKQDQGSDDPETESEATAGESKFDSEGDEMPKQATVVCSSCYCPVQPAARCSVCNAPLDMN